MAAQPPNKVLGGPLRSLSQDAARTRRTGSPGRNQIAYATVGHEDPNPQYVRFEDGQVYVEVTMQPEADEIVARLACGSAGDGIGSYIPLSFGCRVIIELVDGDPQRAVITGRLYDGNCSMPESVAGMATGGPSGIAPNWHFLKLEDQQVLAIETQLNGDILIHSGASVHIKADTVYVEGTTKLGGSPWTPPVPSKVGSEGLNTPTVPMLPNPLDTTPPIPKPVPPNTLSPFTGAATTILRAKDGQQSYIAVDPQFWAWITAVGLHPLIIGTIGLPPPIACHSVASQAQGTIGGHTASDQG